MSRIRGLGFAATAATAIALIAAGCGSSGSSGSSDTIIRGTTDQPVSYDPAGAYDLPSYDILYNVYQTLLVVPPGGNDVEPEAAQKCDFTDSSNTTYECTLKDGIKFSDGSPLTSEDVKYSFDRNLEIASPTGGSSLIANLKSTEAPDPKTVIFHLKQPDVTFPFVISAASFAIVPSDVYPKDKLQPDDEVVGSGRYTVASYEPGQQTVLKANPEYTGEDPPIIDTAITQYFDKSSALKLAVEQGDVDVAYRGLSPTDLADLKNTDGVNVVGGQGIEIRYLVFNEDLQPGDTEEQKTAIRRAVAYTIDRQAIADRVYDGTVQPLYSVVPSQLKFATEEYKDEYGDSPDLDAAKSELQKAGVKTPVDLEIWWTPTHYGAGSADEYAEIEHELEDSGLFNVTLKSSEWNQYSTAYATDKYPIFQLGFFPDYPDADDYAGNLEGSTSFLADHYSNPQVDQLLAKEKAATDDATRAKAFEEIGKAVAPDAPVIPIWQGGQIAAVRDGVNGVEDTFDPAFVFRFWLLSKD